MRVDPRWWQIGSLTALLTWGVVVLEFDVTPVRIAAIVTAALATQFAGSRLTHVAFEWKSAMISALSTCLLLRSNSAWLLVVAAVIAVGSKFVVRWNGKHIFNPTNGAIVAMMLLTDRVWVSPGQWGSAAFFGFLILCAGGLVVYRSARSDITLAFLAIWAAIQFGRAFSLGDPLAIPLHRLENGALLIFAFFMISDPKTTPDSRVGRILFAALVAGGAWYVHYRLFRTNGLLWSLAIASPLVPFIDFVFRGRRFDWLTTPHLKEASMHRIAISIALIAAIAFAPSAQAFCGFYVAKGDAKLFNKASQVVLVRDGDRTVLTMANDYQGDPKEFAVVVPVPQVLQRGQIRVSDKALIDHLDAYTAPRLVEYHDPDPCRMVLEDRMSFMAAAPTSGKMEASRDRALGVTIEARYTVGEYDILILSARESAGLETWLVENGYRMPRGASEVLGSYIRQNLKFFVAKVNLKEQARLGFRYLRPLQVAYESPKFMLPIRLGTVNANGTQELFIYALTRTGRVETTNYRTVRVPSDVDLPVSVRAKFGEFYKAMFTEQVKRNRMSAVFLEYAWDMSWCDPCAADPLSTDELRRLGVFWLGDDDARSRRGGGGGVDVFVSRLHVRYDGAHFPDDLVFQETGDRSNFQARYILRNAWKGDASQCEAAKQYVSMLREREARERATLAELTGWRVDGPSATIKPVREKKWWEW